MHVTLIRVILVPKYNIVTDYTVSIIIYYTFYILLVILFTNNRASQPVLHTHTHHIGRFLRTTTSLYTAPVDIIRRNYKDYFSFFNVKTE